MRRKLNSSNMLVLLYFDSSVMKNPVYPICRETQLIHPSIPVENVTRRFGKPYFCITGLLNSYLKKTAANSDGWVYCLRQPDKFVMHDKVYEN
jgi:hypothetical protein